MVSQTLLTKGFLISTGCLAIANFAEFVILLIGVIIDMGASYSIGFLVLNICSSVSIVFSFYYFYKRNEKYLAWTVLVPLPFAAYKMSYWLFLMVILITGLNIFEFFILLLVGLSFCGCAIFSSLSGTLLVKQMVANKTENEDGYVNTSIETVDENLIKKYKKYCCILLSVNGIFLLPYLGFVIGGMSATPIGGGEMAVLIIFGFIAPTLFSISSTVATWYCILKNESFSLFYLSFVYPIAQGLVYGAPLDFIINIQKFGVELVITFSSLVIPLLISLIFISALLARLGAMLKTKEVAGRVEEGDNLFDEDMLIDNNDDDDLLMRDSDGEEDDPFSIKEKNDDNDNGDNGDEEIMLEMGEIKKEKQEDDGEV